MAALVQMAGAAKVSHHRPVGAFVQDLPRTDLDQCGHIAGVSEQVTLEPVREKVDVVFTVGRPALDKVHDA